MTNKEKEKIGEYISKLDEATGRLIVAAMKDKTVKDAMEIIMNVSVGLGDLV